MTRQRRSQGGEKSQLQALRSHGSIEDRLAEYGKKLGIKAGDHARLLRPTRHVERPGRDVLSYLLRQEGRFR